MSTISSSQQLVPAMDNLAFRNSDGSQAMFENSDGSLATWADNRGRIPVTDEDRRVKQGVRLKNDHR